MYDFKMNGQIIGGAAETSLNAETISEGLENHSIEYADFFGEFIKAKTSININCIKGEKTFNYTIGIRKDELSGEYVITAWDCDFRDIYVKNLGFKVMSGGNVARAMRAVAEAVVACADDFQDYIDAGYYIGDRMLYLESTIEENTSYIDDAIDEVKDTIDGLAEQDWWDLDMDGIKENISEACSMIADCLNEIGRAGKTFIDDLSDFYECDFGFGDAYSDIPEIDLQGYYSDIEYFNATDAFEGILGYLFETPAEKYAENPDKYEELLSLRDTLFHYLAA